ncbi:MAG: putative lipid II flippase FtsW [Spirochaetaceae bacterium]|jgi:cell division protein FtsW|nr:putative lipid II flippase FtsW [Spirochaetaceae bacterium]
MEMTTRKLHFDHVLIASVFLLTGIGLVTLYSASYAFGNRFFGNGMYFISRQILYCALGTILFLIASWFPLDLLRRLIPSFVLGTILLCLLTFVPGLGVMKNGAVRWIRLGSYTYQPSELVKLVLPLYLAHIFDKKQERIEALASGALPPVLVTGLFFMLIYMQNNFSTALFIALNGLFLFYLVGIRIRYFIGATCILLPFSGLLILSEAYRLQRLLSFIWPEWEPQGAGYQVRSSLLTIGSGGFWGKGIGQGTRKIASVPEIHSDFIFSSYAEEFGYLGILLFFLLFSIFTIRGYRAALRAGDGFRRLLAAGLITMISSQALINIAVVSGILPATGIPLPFFSAGGSSLATTLLAAGLIANVSRSAAGPALGRMKDSGLYSPDLSAFSQFSAEGPHVF